MEWARAQKNPLPKAESLLPTVISGLKLYFDRALGTNLLYRFERPQYREQREKYVTGPTVKTGEQKERQVVNDLYIFHQNCRHADLPDIVRHSSGDTDAIYGEAAVSFCQTHESKTGPSSTGNKVR